jgi:hypothetical protein
MPTKPPPTARPMPELAVRVDPAAPRGHALPVLARLLLELARRPSGAGRGGGDHADHQKPLAE